MSQALQQNVAETLVLERRLEASPQRAFDAFTRPEELAVWFGPEAVTIRNLEADARPGGAYRLEMHYADGTWYGLAGEYLEVEPPSRLVMTWIWENGDYAGRATLVTIELSPDPRGTLLRLTHENLADVEACDKHRSGWSSTFDCLERHLGR